MAQKFGMNYVPEKIKLCKSFSTFVKKSKAFFLEQQSNLLKSDIVKRFFSHINSIEASIKFTIEYEKEDKLPFLDILVMKKKKWNIGNQNI